MMPRFPFAVRLASLFSLAVLTVTACGGGGTGGGTFLPPGGGSDTLRITYAVEPFGVIAFDDELADHWCERLTLDPAPAALPFARISDSGATFQPGPASFHTMPDGTFLLCPALRPTLTQGAHTGTLTLDLCKDEGCSRPYTLSDPSLPYDVTVWHVVPGLPPLSAIIRIDGVVSTDVREGLSGDVRTYDVTLVNGQVVEILPSEPYVIILRRAGPDAAQLAWVPPSQSGAIAWEATIPGTSLPSATVSLTLRSSDGRTIEVTVTVTR